MNMSTTVQEALEASIRHWERVVFDPLGEPIGSGYCKLCCLYNNGMDDDCYECPVFAHTGRAYCKGTPYIKYINIELRDSNIEQLRKLANDELQFLISLREEDSHDPRN